MKCVQLKGLKQLEVTELDNPTTKEDSVLVKVKATGICGSDIHYWDMGQPEGLVFGHEFAGEVIDSNNSEFNVGDRVTALPISPCLNCEMCNSGKEHLCAKAWDDTVGLSLGRTGGYGEILNAKKSLTIKLPDSLTYEEGALIEPAAVAYHSVELANINEGEKVLIVGAGIIGLLTAEFAKLKNPSNITILETNPTRAKKAMEYGIVNNAFDPREENIVEKLLTSTNGGYDSVIECVGNEMAIDESIKLCKSGRTVVLAGVSFMPVPISTKDVVMREVNLQGTICYTKKDFVTTMNLIANKTIKVEKYITKKINLEQVQDAFEELTSGTDDNAKILIKY